MATTATGRSGHTALKRRSTSTRPATSSSVTGSSPAWKTASSSAQPGSSAKASARPGEPGGRMRPVRPARPDGPQLAGLEDHVLAPDVGPGRGHRFDRRVTTGRREHAGAHRAPAARPAIVVVERLLQVLHETALAGGVGRA